MRVFLTGASGFVGSAVAQELLKHGHQVTGLARSESSAHAIANAGLQVHRGDVQDLDSLRSGASAADAVIHCGFIHDFSSPERFQAICQIDRAAIGALADALAGTPRPLIVSSGTAITSGTTEDAPSVPASAIPRAATEQATMEAAARGVHASLVRLPPSVHGEGDHGFVPELVSIARTKGFSASIGDGENVWPSVYRGDAARLYRLALEKGSVGARYHAVHDTGVPTRLIAEAIGKGLGLPTRSISLEDAPAHFGWVSRFFQWNVPSSSTLTRNALGWTPEGPTLLQDLAAPHYFQS